MTIGGALALIAAGAILKWAITAHLSFIDLQTTGTVLFIVGLAGLVVAVVYTFWWGPRARDDEAETRVAPPPRAPNRRY
jgi:hypothetical protein